MRWTRAAQAFVVYGPLCVFRGGRRRTPRRRVRARARPPGGRLGRIIITHKNRSTAP